MVFQPAKHATFLRSKSCLIVEGDVKRKSNDSHRIDFCAKWIYRWKKAVTDLGKENGKMKSRKEKIKLSQKYI